MRVPFFGKNKVVYLPNQTRKIDSGPGVAPHYLESSIYFPLTPESSELCIRRIFSTNYLKHELPALLMVHGLGCDSNIFRIPNIEATGVYDLKHLQSFANLLAAEGFDVYLAHLSIAARIFTRLAARHYKTSIYSKIEYKIPDKLNFDDLVKDEAITLIKTILDIRKEEGLPHANIFWLGHSMGGMLIYALLGQFPEYRDLIKAAVTISSPVIFDQNMILLLDLVNNIIKMLQFNENHNLINIAGRNLALLGSALSKTHQLPVLNNISRYFYNPDNTSGNAVAAYFKNAAEPIPIGLKHHFLKWRRERKFTSFDGSIDYLEKMSSIRVPFLILRGMHDHLAPPENVRLAYENLSYSTLKDIPKCGHGDIIFGRSAKYQVWHLINDWLQHPDRF
ncbi:alpha/beta fold hydrolase [Candidatus Margulisiibacteriota bacterium]